MIVFLLLPFLSDYFHKLFTFDFINFTLVLAVSFLLLVEHILSSGQGFIYLAPFLVGLTRELITLSYLC